MEEAAATAVHEWHERCPPLHEVEFRTNSKGVGVRNRKGVVLRYKKNDNNETLAEVLYSPDDRNEGQVGLVNLSTTQVKLFHVSTEPLTDDELSRRPRVWPGGDEQGAKLLSSCPQELTGRRLAVWWEEESETYRGNITGFSAKTGKHRIRYDDGDNETLDLNTQAWRLMGGGVQAGAKKPVDAVPGSAEARGADAAGAAGSSRAAADGDGAAAQQAASALDEAAVMPAGGRGKRWADSQAASGEKRRRRESGSADDAGAAAAAATGEADAGGAHGRRSLAGPAAGSGSPGLLLCRGDNSLQHFGPPALPASALPELLVRTSAYQIWQHSGQPVRYSMYFKVPTTVNAADIELCCSSHHVEVAFPRSSDPQLAGAAAAAAADCKHDSQGSTATAGKENGACLSQPQGASKPAFAGIEVAVEASPAGGVGLRSSSPPAPAVHGQEPSSFVVILPYPSMDCSSLEGELNSEGLLVSCRLQPQPNGAAAASTGVVQPAVW